MTLSSAEPETPTSGRAFVIEPFVAAALVTTLVGLASAFVPDAYASTAIAGVFLLATWFFVWRKPDAVVERHGLTLGGIVLPNTPYGTTARRGLVALAWALGAALVVFGPFFLGFKVYWTKLGFLSPAAHFNFPWTPKRFASDAAAQVLMVALPEEAFYRGFLQTRLTALFSGARTLSDIREGSKWATALAIVLTSAIFAVGHFITIHHVQRLAVFFPSLVFGLLRTRTRGIGAPILFHAFCNLFSEMLGRGFGLF
ncbi:MAG: MrtC family glutamic-type intramembrane protease [Polyangiaceae bacterium]